MSAVQAHPPLRVWLISALLAAGLFVVLANLHQTDWLGRLPGERGLNLGRLTLPGAAPRVVAVGTSKTMNALMFDARFEQGLAGGVRFQRISWSSATFADLQPAFEALAQHPPAVLLLESDLLLYNRQHSPPAQHWLHQAKLNMHRLLLPLYLHFGHSRESEQNWGEEVQPGSASCRALKTPEAVQTYVAGAASWTLFDAGARENYLRYLRALRKAGTRIVLLDIPHSPTAAVVFPPGLQQRADGTLAAVLQAEGFAYWRPSQPPESAYCDQGHLNGEGRVIYTRWLQQRLNDELRGAHA